MTDRVHLTLDQIDELIRCTAYSYEAGDYPEDASEWVRRFGLGDGGLMSLQDSYRDAIEDIARLKGERGTALQAAQCYRAQRDLAWAEIDRLEEQLVEAKAESRHIANNLDVQRLGRKLAEAGGTVVGPSRDADTQTIMHHFDD